MGAWIETAPAMRLHSRSLSHLSWVRGLKLASIIEKNGNVESHLSWVRGLKHELMCLEIVLRYVAPFVGAWIETALSLLPTTTIDVAPFVGAWIETPTATPIGKGKTVAPFVGAWIET